MSGEASVKAEPVAEVDSDDEPLDRKRKEPESADANGTKKVKTEPNGTSSKADDSDDDKPLSLKTKKATVKKEDPGSDDEPLAKKKPAKKPVKAEIQESDSDEAPIVPKKRAAAKKKAAIVDSSDDEPLTAKLTKKKPAAKKEHIDSDDSDTPLVKRKAKGKQPPAKKAKVEPKKGGKKGKEEAAPVKKVKVETPVRKWWTEPKRPPGVKWLNLEHNGVLFSAPYKPHGIKMRYDGKFIKLTPEQEEVATMYAVMAESDHLKNEDFRRNFFRDFRELLGPNHEIQVLEKCDFTPITTWAFEERDKKKTADKEVKKAEKAERDEREAPYLFCNIDGMRERLGNFRVEPPGLFRGRGKHPKTGTLKKRYQPEEITLNLGENARVPICPVPGHCWKSVIHNNKVTWLAYWRDNVNNDFKYVFLDSGSALKGESDMKKFETARRLKLHIDKIRQSYTKELTDSSQAIRQRATAMYIIDKLALRVGNEKDEDEADTVGCCSLRVEHITLEEPTTLKLDFLGKDSIRYENTVTVDPQVFKNLKEFCKGKDPTDEVFNQLATSDLNKHLKDYMDGLTAKVFRTYNASITLDRMLHDDTSITAESPLKEKELFYNRANREVAILCNHQRAVPKAHAGQTAALNEALEDMKKQLAKLKKQIKKKEDVIDEKTQKVVAPERAKKMAESLEERIRAKEHALVLKEELKTVALGTSKINYLDPRITTVWCEKTGMPLTKIFNKSLLKKFTWAMEVDPDWRF